MDFVEEALANSWDCHSHHFLKNLSPEQNLLILQPQMAPSHLNILATKIIETAFPQSEQECGEMGKIEQVCHCKISYRKG